MDSKLKLLEGQIDELREHIKTLAPIHNFNVFTTRIAIFLVGLFLSLFVYFMGYGNRTITNIPTLLVIAFIIFSTLHFMMKSGKKLKL